MPLVSPSMYFHEFFALRNLTWKGIHKFQDPANPRADSQILGLQGLSCQVPYHLKVTSGRWASAVSAGVVDLPLLPSQAPLKVEA